MKFLKIVKSCLVVACIALTGAKNLNKNQNTNLASTRTQCDCNENKEKFLSSNTGCSSYKMGGCGKATCIHSDSNLDIATWKYNWDWEFSSKFFFIIYGSDIGSPSALSAQAKTLNMNVGPTQSLTSVINDNHGLDSLKNAIAGIRTSKSGEQVTKTPKLAGNGAGLEFSAPVAHQ